MSVARRVRAMNSRTAPGHWVARRTQAMASTSYDRGGAGTSARRYRTHRLDRAEWSQATHAVRTELREAARELDRNNPIYQRILDADGQNVVARGPRVTPNTGDPAWNAAATEIYREHCQQYQFSPERLRDEHTTSMLLRRTIVRDGGCLAYHPFGRTQVFEDGQIVTPRERTSQTNIKDGVEFNRRTGALDGYWVGPYSRYGIVDERDAVFVPAWHIDRELGVVMRRTVYHQRPKFISGYRGISPSASAGDHLERCEEYWEALNERAIQEASVFGALFAKNRERARKGMNTGRDDDNSTEPGQEEYDRPAYIEPGTVWSLHPEDKFELFATSTPNAQFAELVRTAIRFAAICLNQPLEIAMMLFDRNFSASRATVELYKLYARLEKQRHVRDWTLWDYEWAIYDAIVDGRLTARPDWRSVLIAPDGWSYLDPKAEALAIRYRFDNGEATMTEVLADTGRDLREHYDLRANDYLVAADVAAARAVPIQIIAPHLFSRPSIQAETDPDPETLT